ncbi:MAG: hypothetical protein ACREP6_09730 [Candidatus Binataceae bacterium]
MSALPPKDLHFLLDAESALVVFQEKDASWAAVLAFSSEDLAQGFLAASCLEAHEIAAIDTGDAASVAALVAGIKRRAIRHMLLDLDYRTGRCKQVEFEGDGFGEIRERQLSPQGDARG